MKFIIGLIIMLVGFLLVWKSEWFLNNFGRIGWFEQHLGSSGGTRLGYKLLGMFTVFIGLLVVIGLIDGFLGWVLAPVINIYR
jgi:hypothetical protein